MEVNITLFSENRQRAFIRPGELININMIFGTSKMILKSILILYKLHLTKSRKKLVFFRDYG